ncbi:alpha/beta fold hydrolase [Rhizobium herbae]|uniref:AB hydrolase-1 domain-containing protein n=1 Tax=Rhizobium herbae TaxID=508661 RepID=A0ABS4EWC7_9HYPH|nr:hypothetical protein [Rhizobium herbae]MBP1862261.1 hypothetical protein [Rhizobium herbae]
MSKLSLAALTAFILSSSIAWGCTDIPADRAQNVEVGYTAVDRDVTLRRMVVHNSKPKVTVLLLHGFPEIMCAWTDISLKLGKDYKVHAIDWPGVRSFNETPGREIFLCAKRVRSNSTGMCR